MKSRVFPLFAVLGFLAVASASAAGEAAVAAASVEGAALLSCDSRCVSSSCLLQATPSNSRAHTTPGITKDLNPARMGLLLSLSGNRELRRIIRVVACAAVAARRT